MKFFPKAVLFDFDGTLAVLTLNFSEMRQAVYDALKQTFSPSIMAHYNKRKPVMEALAELHPHLQEEELFKARQVAEAALIDFEVDAAKRSSLFPFTIPVLDRLGKNKIPCAIVTRNCRESVETVFPDHASYCSALLTRNDVNNVKPHPDHLLSALHPLDVSPDEALMVGDHPLDIIAGKNAGCKSAGVLSGGTKLEIIVASEPDFMARDVEELMQQLDI